MAPYLRKFGAYTVPDFLGARYGGNFARLLGVMVLIFGSIPFTDAVIVRYVDDRMRSRVAGLRLTLSLGFSSLAVWALGPAVKASGFGTLLLVMAGISLFTVTALLALPSERSASAAS